MSALRELGTVAFDYEVMHKLIGFGGAPPTTLQLGVWLSFVPETYRPVAMYCAHAIAERFINEPATPLTLTRFVGELQAECLREFQKQRQEGYRP